MEREGGQGLLASSPALPLVTGVYMPIWALPQIFEIRPGHMLPHRPEVQVHVCGGVRMYTHPRKGLWDLQKIPTGSSTENWTRTSYSMVQPLWLGQPPLPGWGRGAQRVNATPKPIGTPAGW